ncbi:MAG: putative sortase-sorted surface protein [Pseudonocardiales bacterium]|nr:putative sortase-sorted surface protein [Pseudonocardiales bacterium]
MLAVGGGLAVSGIAVGADSGPTSAERTTVLAYDAFNRSVGSGWGTAETGGSYNITTNDAGTKVASGAGQILSLASGRLFTSRLVAADSVDTRSRVVIQIPSVPKSGGGLYVMLGLRTQSDSTRYLAKVHISAGGAIALSFSRVDSKGEAFLGVETPTGQKITSGGVLTFEAEATGTSPVSLRSHAWVSSNAVAAWQLKTTDASASRVQAAGYVSTNFYVSSTTPTSSAYVTDLAAWKVNVTGSAAPPVTPAPPATTAPPTKTPTPPTTPAPPVTPTPPTQSGGVGSAAIGTTTYPIPSGAIIVSPSGSDSNKGTAAAPLRTLTRAVLVAPSGSTIVLMAGTYHEEVNVDHNRRLTIQSAPNNAVWLDGSSAVGSWTQSGHTWIHTGWTAQFDYTPSYTGTVYTQQGWGFVDPAYPYAARPDQIWINGSALTQVGSAAAVTAGKFYVDNSGNRLVIGDNPAGREVRASDLAVALSIRSANSVVRGIGIRRYGTPVKEMGTLRILGANDVVENVVTSDNATTGMTLLATGLKVSHVTAQRNGMLGIHGNEADNLTISKVLSQNNNLERFNTSPVAGGIKISRTRNIVIRDSIMQDNVSSTGLWLDESCYNAVIINNSIVNNGGHGFFMEISSQAIVSDNVITGNAGDGVKINDTDKVRFWNNTLGSNGLNMELVQDSRNYLIKGSLGHDTRQKFPDPTMTWKLGNIQVYNNILPRSGGTNLYIRDYTGARAASSMGISVDGNLFTRNASDTFIVWGTRTGVAYLRSAADVAKIGAGSHNAENVAGVLSAIASTVFAQPLPSDIASWIGQPAGTRKVGAF